MPVEFPSGFPTKEEMFAILHKTIEKSWRVDIDQNKIEAWLNNFTGKVYGDEEEKRLALWLLCNYTYYTSDDINHLCRILYTKFVHDLICRDGISVDEIENALKNVSFSSVGDASESGGLILYHFRQEANLTLEQFFYPTSIEYGEDAVVVFIDDATLGGGTCLRNFYDKEIENKPNKHIYYLTIMASQEAKKKLEEKGIIVICCAVLDERNKCFNEKSMMFNKYSELREPCKKLAQEYGADIVESPVKPLGYKDGEFCFGFYYNTPNNTLPIFWSSKNWTPIFARKEKLQNVKQFSVEQRKYI